MNGEKGTQIMHGNEEGFQETGSQPEILEGVDTNDTPGQDFDDNNEVYDPNTGGVTTDLETPGGFTNGSNDVVREDIDDVHVTNNNIGVGSDRVNDLLGIETLEENMTQGNISEDTTQGDEYTRNDHDIPLSSHGDVNDAPEEEDSEKMYQE